VPRTGGSEVLWLWLWSVLTGLSWASCVSAQAPTLASKPVITSPSGLHVAPGVARAMTGISATAPGATPSSTTTATLDCTACVITATGSTITGSGTNHLSFGPDTLAHAASAFQTLQVAYNTAALTAGDTVLINVTITGVAADQFSYALNVDGTKYLNLTTPAAAQSRSQQQCQALANPCQGDTIYWWEVRTDLTDGTGALRTIPGDPRYDKICTSACPGGAASSGKGLNTTEQSNLKDVTQIALPLPGAKP